MALELQAIKERLHYPTKSWELAISGGLRVLRVKDSGLWDERGI